ncbi:MAG: hypothetical protein ABW252_13735 [Polyangiales bacterium]
MAAGARITDAVTYLREEGNFRGAVRLVRTRRPERLRWRAAVAAIVYDAAHMQGRARMRVEEPIRELVLQLEDPILQREVVLDARLHRVDLDRGEVLPRWTVGDLRRLAFLAGTDLDVLSRYVQLASDFDAPIDTAAVVLAGRALATVARQRSAQLKLGMLSTESRSAEVQRHLLERAQREAEHSRRWAGLAKALTFTR